MFTAASRVIVYAVKTSHLTAASSNGAERDAALRPRSPPPSSPSKRVERSRSALHHLARRLAPNVRGFWRISARERKKVRAAPRPRLRSEEHTSERQSLMRISYAV